MISLSADRLAPLMTAAFEAVGVRADGAHDVTASVIQASLRGVDSHGIHLFPHYVGAVQHGRVNPAPAIEVEQTAASTARLRADHAFGHHAGAVAIDRALELAQSSGVGVISVGESTHFGAAAYFALRASAGGNHLAFAFTNADALVQPFNARTAFLGTNPICFTAPMAEEAPLCLDMATSHVSWNKVLSYRAAGQPLDAGLAFDAQGDPTCDAAFARSLAPIGTYKGYGLGMMIEILCGVLAGGPVARAILPMYSAPLSARRSISHFFMVIDIARFNDPDVFRQSMQAMAQGARALEALPDAPVLVPGDPEKKNEAHRRRTGIPITKERFAQFTAIDPAFAEAVIAWD